MTQMFIVNGSANLVLMLTFAFMSCLQKIGNRQRKADLNQGDYDKCLDSSDGTKPR